MRASGADHPPATVTAEYAVRFKRPSSSAGPLTFRSRVVDSGPDRATIEAIVESEGVVCATCRGTFVAVKPGHPAYHRWE
jgi:acyl-coenzyme A thioesterase PaaI-like protein